VGVLDRFEKGIERAVNGAFAKAFRSEVQPVEIASALRRECDEKAAVVGRDRTIAPNTFVVELGPADYGRLGEWKDALGDELCTSLHEHARQQRYAFVGPVSVTFEEVSDLDTGVFRVRSSTTRAQGGEQGPMGYGHPPGGGYYPGQTPYRPAPAPGQQSYVPGPPAPGQYPMGAPGMGAPGYPGQRPSPQGYQPAYPDRRAPAASPAPMPPNAHPGGGWQPQPPEPPAGPIAVSLDVDGRVFRLSAPVTVIGRSSEADIVLDDPGISRRHVEIHVDKGQATVVDLGSTNGTFVDGERIKTVLLDDGSTITVGRTRMVARIGRW
jgi:hypothetical protein